MLFKKLQLEQHLFCVVNRSLLAAESFSFENCQELFAYLQNFNCSLLPVSHMEAELG